MTRLNNNQAKQYQMAVTSQRQQPFFANENGEPLYNAFNELNFVYPKMGENSVDSGDIPRIWAWAMDSKGEKCERVAYFHIPFCETHCIYCFYYKNLLPTDEGNYYVDYVIQELEMIADTPFINSHPFHAIYLGGGTPTALSAHNLKRLLKSIRKYLPLANDCEITVEGRIYNFTDEKISACIDGGANRFSIGVQTFDTSVRQKMGRKENKESLIERLQYLRNLDQAPMSIDLIFGLPYQTMEIWADDVTQFVQLELDGLSTYPLLVLKGTKLEKAINKGIMPPPGDIITKADMFLRGVEIMNSTRCHRIFFNHWAKTSRERSIYPKTAAKDCVPFGSGARGQFKGYLLHQDSNLKEYYKKIDEGHKPIAWCGKPSEHYKLFLDLVGQMEMRHCNIRRIGQRYGPDLEEIFSPLLKQWERVGLIKMDEGWIELTLAGEFWLGNLCQGLVDYFFCNYQHDSC